MYKSLFALFSSLLASTAMANVDLTGTASYRERMTLPANAVFEVSLQDVSLADAPAKVVARTVLVSPGQPPIAFKLRFEPKELDPRHSYALSAQITVDGKLLFITDSRRNIKANGSDGPQTLLLVSASEAAVQATPLQNSYWKLVELAGKPVLPDSQSQEAHLLLSSEGRRLAGSTGCNRMSGGYILVGGSIHFTSVATTRMACLKGGEQEQPLLDALAKVKRWRIQADRLSLFDSKNQLLLVFQAGTQPKA